MAADGYILTVLGPFLADGQNSDAKIPEHMLKSNSEVTRNWFKEDVLINDKKFRDVTELLNECGMKMAMSTFLNKSENQYNTEEANESSLFTKVRWVLESANGGIR